MSTGFHKKPFDEGTLTKLQIFELYSKEWLPVFLSKEKPKWLEIHLFDFFAGPGTDSEGEFGSPLRLLRQLKECQTLTGFSKVQTTVHFFDSSAGKIQQLKENIGKHGLQIDGVTFDIQSLPFAEAFQGVSEILLSRQAAKLVFADQFGVDQVSDETFRRLVASPTCDFLFFISSSTLHRFREHPAIRQKISRPDDYYHVHRAVLEYYRGQLPRGSQYFLAPFSIKKGSNIYGLIFGSGHPLGMDKFLRVAWNTDELHGEANFDINRDDILPGEMFLPLDEFRPSKVTAFERDLERMIRAGRCPTEREVIWKCFDHGVARKHAEPILTKLKKEGVIDLDFRVPDVDRLREPRPIELREP